MNVELTCTCSAYIALKVKSNDTDAAWHLIWRYTNAHVNCGFAAPASAAADEVTKTVET